MMKIFNNKHELSIRALLILYSFNKELTIEGIAAIDLITTYGKEFELLNYNLHGNNPLSFCEISTRRIEMKESMKFLVIKGMVNVISSKNGFLYIINEKGKNICEQIESEYGKEYLKLSKILANKLDFNTEQEIINYVLSCSLKGGVSNV